MNTLDTSAARYTTELTISSAQFADTGKYKCVYQYWSGVSISSDLATLVVQGFPPPQPVTMNVVKGASFVFSCEATGSAEATIKFLDASNSQEVATGVTQTSSTAGSVVTTTGVLATTTAGELCMRQTIKCKFSLRLKR